MAKYTIKELQSLEISNLKLILTNTKESIYKTGNNESKIWSRIDKSHGEPGKRICPGISTFKKILKEEYKSHNQKKQLIDFIIFLQKEFDVDTKKEDNSIVAQDESFLDLFYWRVDGSSNETIGVAKLHIYKEDDKEVARLKYFYHSKNTSDAFLEGDVWTYGRNIYISLKDKTGDNIQADTFLILHSASVNYKEFSIGIITSTNRVHGMPISSVFILEKSAIKDIENSIYISSFYFDSEGKERRKVYLGKDADIFLEEDKNEVKKGVDDRIIYYLSGRQIRTEIDANIIKSIDNLITNNDYLKMEDFEGTFENTFFLTSTSKPSLRRYIITITKGGLAQVLIDKKTKETGRSRIILNGTKTLLLLQFVYDPTTRTYKYSLLLEKTKDGYLEGIFCGVFESEQSSGRVILKNTTKESLPKSKIYLQEVNPLEELAQISDNDDYIKKFFIGSVWDSNTDVGMKKIIEPYLPKSRNQNIIPIEQENPILDEMFGTYDCYFNTKKIETKNNNDDSSKFGQTLYLIPLDISEKGILLKFYDETLNGSVTYDNKKMILVFEGKDYYISILLRPSVKPKIVYGLFNIIIDKNNKFKYESMQSCYIIMERTNQSFDKIKPQFFETLTELSNIEKNKFGLITKVFGHFNRVVFTREPNDLGYSFPRQKSYRRTFWNSACFNGMLYEKDKINNEDCISDAYDDLVRAYHHGFGMKYWSDKEYGQEGFPKELAEEYEMILNEYNNPLYFKDEKIRDFLKKRIDFTISNK